MEAHCYLRKRLPFRADRDGGGLCRGRAHRPGRIRPGARDVEQVRPDYPNARFSGFKLASDIGRLGAGRKTITVRALARTGIVREERVLVEIPKLARTRRAVVDEGFHHHCDEIAVTTSGQIVVKGWAVSVTPIASV